MSKSLVAIFPGLSMPVVALSCSPLLPADNPRKREMRIGTYIVLIGFALASTSNAVGQSSLPPCPATSQFSWSHCFGTHEERGAKYVGEFRDGRYHGRGTYTLPGGTKYIGEFQVGKYHGQGTYTRPGGTTYVGEFQDGRYHGQGSLTSSAGERYIGEFRHDKQNGRGVRVAANGATLESGHWEDGKLIRSYAVDIATITSDAKTAQTSDFESQPLERDRLLGELEAERRHRRQLEERLAAEARESERLQAQAQPTPQPPRPQAALRPERRVALIVGNAAYKFSPLDNPVNDATDVDAGLKRAGFQTTLLRNATLAQMREATRRFADQLTTADVALIYFAGHGIESRGRNYMVPVNADLKFEHELLDQAFDANQWLEILEGIRSANADRVNIVILDACRNNNLIGARSLSRGLGRLDAPTGTFLAYSTAPGKVAADGPRGQRNSPFTKHLLQAMQQPNQPIEEVFKEVRRNVSRETAGAQVPWESTSLTGFFSFRPER